MKNFKYWYAHWKMVQKIAKQHSCWRFRFLFHDLEKPFLQIFLSHECVQKIHRSYSCHHARGYDYLQMVVDWESARFTKPDKPLTARETCDQIYPWLQKHIYPILEKYNFK